MFFQCYDGEKWNRRSNHNSAYIVSILSVADPGCLSRIPDPDFYPSKIPDPTKAPKEEGEILLCPTIFCSDKYNKIVNNFFEQVKIFLAKTLRILVLFTQKFVINQKKGLDSGIRKNLFRIPDPG